jgi:lipopolysaccharide transport system permease protein
LAHHWGSAHSALARSTRWIIARYRALWIDVQVSKEYKSHASWPGKNFWQLLYVKIKFNIRSEAAKSYLSYAWWILEPLLQMGVYYVVFAIFLHRGRQDFVPFLLCGVVPWLSFARSVVNSSRSMIQGRGLISQTYIPKPFFPLVIIGQDLFKQFYVYLMLFAALIYLGYTPSLGWLWMIPIVVTLLLVLVSAGFFVAFIIPFARDLQYLVNAGLMMLMFGSGIFYSYEDVLIPEHRDLFLLNPLANIIVNHRRVLLENEAPMIGSLLGIFLIAVSIILLMSWLMRRFDNTLTRLATE